MFAGVRSWVVICGGCLLVVVLGAPTAAAHTRFEQCLADASILGQNAAWNDAELFVWEQACARQRADFDADVDRFGDAVDDERRQVGGEFLRTVLTEQPFRGWLEDQPLFVSAAWFPDGFNLSQTSLPGGLFIELSQIDGIVDLGGTTIPGSLSLNGTGFLSQLTDGDEEPTGPTVVLDGAVVRGDVFATEGVFGDFTAIGARIGGDFNAPSSTFTGILTLDRATVTGPVFLQESVFGAAGVADFTHAEIGDNVHAEGATFTGDTGITFDSATIAGSILLTDASVGGPVDLRNAAVGRDAEFGGTGFGDTVDLESAVIGVNLIADCLFGDAVALDEASFEPGEERQPPCTFGEGLAMEGARVGGKFSAKDVTFDGDVQMVGADIARGVGLVGAVVDGEVVLENATVGSGVDLDEATFVFVSLLTAHVGGEVTAVETDLVSLELTAASVGSVRLQPRSTVDALSLLNADVGDDVSVSGSVGELLMLNAAVGGDVIVDGNVTVFGDGADVDGNVDISLSGGELFLFNAAVGRNVTLQSEGDPVTVTMFNSRIGGDMNAWGTFGSSVLYGADIGGIFDASDAEFASLDLIGASVARDLFLARATFHGGVLLANIEVGGDVDASGGRFSGTEFPALQLDGAVVGANVILTSSDGCDGDAGDFNGLVELDGARIAGDLDLTGATFHDDFSLRGSTIGGVLRFDDEDARPVTWNGGLLDMRGADVGGIVEVSNRDAALAAWPTVRLTGFNYGATTETAGPQDCVEAAGVGEEDPDQVEGFLDHDAGWYRDWLLKEEEFSRSPYLALEAALRDAGKANVAEDVAIARRDRELRVSGVWYEQALGLVHKWTVGYGHKPERSVYWIVGFIVLGWLVGSRLVRTEQGRDLGIGSPLMFSIDRLLPVVTLRDAYAQVDIEQMPKRYQAYYGVHVFAGYALAAALVTAFSGLAGG